MTPPLFKAHQLSCIRGTQRLFKAIDLQLNAGEWLYIQGENGAGKTSLLKILAGLARPAEGSIWWDHVPIEQQRQRFHQNLLYLGHHAGLKDDLTLTENLQMLCQMDGCQPSRANIAVALTRMGLGKRQHLPARVLSAGQKRRGLLARTLLRQAKLWILDEPFAALDTQAISALHDSFQAHLNNGGMLILTSHQPPVLSSTIPGQTLNLSCTNAPAC